MASASVFTRVSVPEMRRFGYKARITVGVVAGSSVLGMLIPPNVMLILYAIVAEQSIGEMFIAGVVPGIILSFAYGIAIISMAYQFPNFVGSQISGRDVEDEGYSLTLGQIFVKIFPILLLVVLVLGGIYGGVFTPTEAGAAGAFAALIIAAIKRKLTWSGLWGVLVEIGYITAAILFLLIAASMYRRMLGVAALPTIFGDWLKALGMGYAGIMALYVILLVILGTILDTASIILIVVPLFMLVLEPYGINLVWFGIVTVIGAEIGLLTQPLGISCFTIKSTINDPTISLNDIFSGAFPFAVVMLGVLILVIVFPVLSLVLI
ncbi:TRAP transporter large permease subunit [Nitrospinota bacterium]